jgi:glycosyltransferase involved in cell wall biosynthesis
MSKRPLHILQIVPRLGVGGAEQACFDIAETLLANGHKSFVISDGGRRVPELSHIGAVPIAMPVASKNPLVMWRNINDLVDVLKTNHIDLVHVRSRAPAWSAYFAARKVGIPFVTTFHAAYKGHSVFKKTYNAIMAKGDRIIAISHFLAEHIKARYLVDNRLVTIPRGIDMARFDPATINLADVMALRHKLACTDDAKVFLLPGRLSPIKGHSFFIGALQRFRQKYPQLKFRALLVGDDQGRGDYRRALETLIHEKQLTGLVSLHDHQANVPTLYAMADIIVVPSLVEEGFGRVPVEAMAMGKPVIVTAHGGLKETVIDGVTGFFVKPNDHESFVTAIYAAYHKAGDKKAADAARHHVMTHYDKKLMQAATLKIYEELCHAG